MKYESQPKCIVQYNIGWKKAFDSIFVCFAQKILLGGLTSVAIEKLFFSKFTGQTLTEQKDFRKNPRAF